MEIVDLQSQREGKESDWRLAREVSEGERSAIKRDLSLLEKTIKDGDTFSQPVSYYEPTVMLAFTINFNSHYNHLLLNRR